VLKYGRSGQVTDDNITPGMRFVCWTIDAADVHSDYYYYYYYYSLQLSFHSVAVVLTLVTNTNKYT